MSEPDKPSPETPIGPAQMRVRLKYADTQTFIEKFSANINKQGIFIASRQPKPVGTPIRFELILADGKSRMLKGEGVVTWVRDFDADNPGRPHGMGVRFARLDAESRRMIERIEAYKLERGLRGSDDPVGSSPTLSSPPAEAEPAPVAAAPGELVESLPPDPPPRPRREIPRLDFVVPEASAADVDVEALLGADGATLEAQLMRAREIARAFAGDTAGLESFFEGGDVGAWRKEAEASAAREAAALVPPRRERFQPPPVEEFDSIAQPIAAPPPEPAPVAIAAPVPAPVPAPAPAPPLRISAPRPALSELDAQVDDSTIDNELNFDLDAIDRRLLTPEPAPLPLPPAPAPAVLTQPAAPQPPPRRSVPPPPPPPAFRGAVIGPAPSGAPTRGASGSHETPSVPAVRATAPAPPAPPAAPVDDPTIDMAPTPPLPIEPTRQPDAQAKKGFFSKLFKKQS